MKAYLDNGATTVVSPSVIEKMNQVLGYILQLISNNLFLLQYILCFPSFIF